MQAQIPDARFAFSRPGFLTFKLPGDVDAETFAVQNAFARTWGASRERVEANDPEQGAAKFWELVDGSCDYIHVWQRDVRAVGDGFEPGVTEAASAAAKAIRRANPNTNKPQINATAPVGARVIDCILVEPNQWWLGAHQVDSVERGWVGGAPPLKIPEQMISRAYLKMHEALAWSRLPCRKGDQCVEIGCAPGGAAQAMLEHELKVIGVDPAEVSPLIADDPNFHHIKKRGRDVRRREFAEARWLMSDANVAPQQMLDTVEDIVTHDRVHIRGLLLTLKMPDWKLIDELPSYLERIRNWGYRYVRPRHLAFNRQEICVAAFRSKGIRRFG